MEKITLEGRVISIEIIKDRESPFPYLRATIENNGDQYFVLNKCHLQGALQMAKRIRGKMVRVELMPNNGYYKAILPYRSLD